jgi:ribose-phosphate pyrophosphokinase
MSRPVVLALPGCSSSADRVCAALDGERGEATVREFPDGELYVRVHTALAGRQVVLAGSLDRPAGKLLPLTFLAETARELGAARIGLVAPYLSFLRHDSRFHPGEGLTSLHFARLLSRAVDWLVTVDPHLHRWSSLDQLYAIPTRVVRAAPAIAAWIARHVEHPLVIGPDAESAQWVEAVAAACGAPCLVLEKTRRGDRDVSVTAPALAGHHGRTPVVVDDIISTARTMIAAVEQLARAGAPPPVCVGIHAVFAPGALDELRAAGATRIATCDTIPHPTNEISVDAALAEAARAAVAA